MVMRGEGAQSGPRTLRVIALYAVAFVFLGVVLWRTHIWDISDNLAGLNPLVLAVVPVFSALLGLPLAIRQRAILSALGYRPSAWALFLIAYYGNATGFITPASSGEILRPVLFQRALDIPLPTGVAIVLYERLYSYALFGIVCSLALIWASPLPDSLKVLASPFLLTASLLPLVVYWTIRRIAPHLPWIGKFQRLVPRSFRERFGNVFRESEESLGRLFSSLQLTIAFCLLSYLIFLIMGLQFWILMREIEPSVSFPEAWAVLMASNGAGVLSGLPLGLGATDAVMVSLLRVYGASDAASATAVVLFRGLIHLPTGIMGALAYLMAVRQRAPQSPEAGSASSGSRPPPSGTGSGTPALSGGQRGGVANEG